MNGDGFDIQIHENFECKYKDKKDFELKTECRLCNQIKSPEDKKSIHLCNQEEQKTFCESHKSKENYLFTSDRFSIKPIL